MLRTEGKEEEEVVEVEAVRGGSKCQDCGNQAKKDCSYGRCRTCCNNKGFECQTHIKSTWIPVDKRRQKHQEQQLQPSLTTIPDPQHFQGQDQDAPKRHKAQRNPCYSGLEEFKFPAATSSMAMFRCVQVRSMDDAVNEMAYQTSVNIGGHVFSGLLYDQGPADQSFYDIDRGDSSTVTEPLDHQLHNLSVINASIHTHAYDVAGGGATMAPLSATTTAHETFLPPPFPLPHASFRPGMPPYFSQPKP